MQSRIDDKPKSKKDKEKRVKTVKVKVEDILTSPHSILCPPKMLRRMLKSTCEVVCLDRLSQERLWIVPISKMGGYAVFKTDFVGDKPRKIGYAVTMSSAREHLFRNQGIPREAWTPVPLISMLNVGATA